MACPLSTLLGTESCGRLSSPGSVACAARQLPCALWGEAQSLAPWKLAIAAIVLIAKLPALLAWLREWAAARAPVAFSYPPPPEADPAWRGRVIASPDLFAHERDASLLPAGAGPDDRFITCYDPSSGAHLATLRLETGAEIHARIAAAGAAQPALAASSFAARRRFLRALKAWILANTEAIVGVAVRDTGKTRVDAVFGEILTTLAKLDWLLARGERTLAPARRRRTLLLAHKTSALRYEPLGVVAACVSWNYSFHNALGPLLAALFAGNAVVIKASEQVAWSSAWYIGAVRACLAATGFEPALVQLVVCLPALAEECVTRNPALKHITFIGSEPVGRAVARAAAENLTPTCIELGGKDPAFIMADAYMPFFADTWMRGAFQSAGQNCIGIELFMVPSARQQEFVELMAPKVRALRVGTDVGSLISHAAIPRLERLVAASVKAGATLHAGGRQFHHPERPQGAYFAPTLIADVRMDMPIAREECFAPIMTVVPYDTVEQALAWLKASKFGLGAGVYGANRKACEEVAHRLECGMVSINDFGVFYLNQDLPFGGLKASGHSRFAGPEGLRSLCNPKAVISDTVFKVRTSIPPPLKYPIPDQDRAWGFLSGLVGLGYGSIAGRVRGIVRLIRNS